MAVAQQPLAVHEEEATVLDHAALLSHVPDEPGRGADRVVAEVVEEELPRAPREEEPFAADRMRRIVFRTWIMPACAP